MLKETDQLKKLFINENDSLYKALELIDKTGKNSTKIALVVDSNNKLLGVLNDGDIRRALLENADLNEPVQKYMANDFKYVNEGAGRGLILDKMKAFCISHIPVLNSEKQIVGLHFLNDFISKKVLTNPVIIMAGGKGSRLRPITEDIPKPMIKVAGVPILERLINHFVGVGIRKIFLAVNYKAEIIEKYFSDGHDYGCSISYLKEDKMLGTAGALTLLPPIGEDFILINGDLVTLFDVLEMLDVHNKNNNIITVGVKDYKDKIPYGVVDIEGDQVLDIVEKPERHFPINGGVYILSPEILNIIPENTVYFATNLILDCIQKNKKVGYYFLDECWIDVGEHSQLKHAQGKTL